VNGEVELRLAAFTTGGRCHARFRVDSRREMFKLRLRWDGSYENRNKVVRPVDAEELRLKLGLGYLGGEIWAGSLVPKEAVEYARRGKAENQFAMVALASSQLPHHRDRRERLPVNFGYVLFTILT
jgi:hypothetical protein